MISEVVVKITPANDQEYENLMTTILTLQDVRDAFIKAGSHCESEIEYLKATEHIISEILRGETF